MKKFVMTRIHDINLKMKEINTFLEKQKFLKIF